MTNTELLKAEEAGYAGRLMTALDQQRLFLLRIAMSKSSCPNCGIACSKFEAAGFGHPDRFDAFDVSGATKYDYRCPHCARSLQWAVYFFGGYGWRLVPISTIPARRT